MCTLLFTPGKRGVLTYVCGCGWAGEEPKHVLIPHMWREVRSYVSSYHLKKRDVVEGDGFVCFDAAVWTLSRRPYEYVTLSTKGDPQNPFGTVCPNCGNVLQEEDGLVLDVGSGSRTVTKHWPDGNPYKKEIRTDVIELRLASDPRRMSKYVADKGSSAILWEVLRALEPNMPKKPKMKEFATKDEFWKARSAYKAEWRRVFRAEYSINDLLKAKRRTMSDADAKEQTRHLLVSLIKEIKTEKGLKVRGEYILKHLRMSSKYKFIAMASEEADRRKKAAHAVVDRVMARTTLDAAIAVAEKKGMIDVLNILLSLREKFGNIALRGTALKWVAANRYNVIAVSGAGFKAFEKSTWRYSKFKGQYPDVYQAIVKNGKVYYEDMPGFSMDRGKPITKDDGSSWIYDPSAAALVRLPDDDIHFVEYAERDIVESDEDSWQATAIESVVEELGITEDICDEEIVEEIEEEIEEEEIQEMPEDLE